MEDKTGGLFDLLVEIFGNSLMQSQEWLKDENELVLERTKKTDTEL